jgi:hypothetical protein
MLDRPPGERYQPRPVAASDGTPVGSPRLAWAALSGLAVALATVSGFAAVATIFDVGPGLLAVCAVGGWLLGRAVRYGAWSGGTHSGTASVPGLAVAVALLTWLAAEVGTYLLALAARPDSVLSMGDRIAQSPFLEWLGPQFGPVEILELFLLIGIAGFAAR